MPLTVEQEARVLACTAAHGAAVEAGLGDYPFPHDRMVKRSVLEDVARRTGRPIELMVAWMRRVIDDETVRPLDTDLDATWPTRPDPADAALVVALAADPGCWYYEVRAALLLAERVLQHGPPPAELVDGLLALRARLEDDRLHSSEFFRAKALPWLLRLVAETSPADLVDLAFVDDHDQWAPVVVEAVHDADDPAATGRALLLLGSPRGGKPSKKWWTQAEALLAERPELAAFATDLLDAVTTVDVTARDDERDGWDVPDPFLLTPTNEQLARGLAWALRLVPADDARCEVLGRVVLRSAAMVWVVPAHRMLCPKLASATVDTLMEIDRELGGGAAETQLMSIVHEIRVPPLIRRIGPHLGMDEAQVDELIKALRSRGPLPRPDR